MTDAEYIQTHNIDPLFEGAIKGLARDKPDNIGRWMADYLKGEKEAGPSGGSVEWLMAKDVSEKLEKAIAALVAAKPASPKSWLQDYFKNCEGCTGSCSEAPVDIEDMARAKVFCKGPIPTAVEAGKTYFWCSCGYSQNQPFCDGTHRSINEQYGTKFAPKKFVASATGEEDFCGCRRSEDPVICDYSHLDLSDGEGGREPVVTSFSDYTVVENKMYNHDTVLLTVQNNDKKGEELAKSYHFSLRIGGKARPYTPTHYDAATGTVQLLVKVIEGGAVSPKVRDLKVGETVELKGPSPGEYYCEGQHDVVVLLGGGSGLTPLLQVAQEAVEKNRSIELYLLYSNKTAKDMLWRTELQMLKDKHPGVLKSVTHHLTRDKDAAGEGVHCGRVTADVIKKIVPPASSSHCAILCGTPEFNKAMHAACKTVGYTKSQIVIC
eukprot:TRINITY_DN1307_c1_g1_i5.p1 TRINITY_DN1307_c1_g1~~TRINITY_DN1307_c1_g1_i5.p1  ORF type:complete len:436 (+),score=123.69 TRINITY_DN1307_c1_g1_i5:37-1344(+)